jgi:hypothetical protein
MSESGAPSSVIRTARKDVTCAYCDDPITKGSQAEYTAGGVRKHPGCTKPPRRQLAFYRIATLANGRRAQARLYVVWENIRKRCYGTWRSDYSYYGGRGIAMCDEWRDDYAVFRAWAIATGYRKGLTLDRINNDGNYEPANCRWATREEQTYNSSRPDVITFNGETMISPLWAKRLGMHPQALRSRINGGWSIEEALTIPPGEYRPNHPRGRKPKSASSAAYSAPSTSNQE